MQSLTNFPRAMVSFRHTATQIFDANECIQPVDMVLRIHQFVLVMLTVQFQKRERCLSEPAERNSLSVTAGPAAAIHGNFPSDLEDSLPGNESTFYNGRGRPPADDAGTGPAAEQKVQSLQNQRLSSSRFTGNDVQAGPGTKAHPVHYAKIFYPEFLQHA